MCPPPLLWQPQGWEATKPGLRVTLRGTAWGRQAESAPPCPPGAPWDERTRPACLPPGPLHLPCSLTLSGGGLSSGVGVALGTPSILCWGLSGGLGDRGNEAHVLVCPLSEEARAELLRPLPHSSKTTSVACGSALLRAVPSCGQGAPRLAVQDARGAEEWRPASQEAGARPPQPGHLRRGPARWPVLTRGTGARWHVPRSAGVHF